MPDYFRAVAVDYDGTITSERRPTDPMLAAIRSVRSANRRIVLVTGRILAELVADFPDVYGHFDAVVGENGAVLWHNGYERALVPAVSVHLYEALRSRGVWLRRGQVILATSAVDDQAIREECNRLGLDYKIAHNRSELMVLPTGVSKATGLHAALETLGVSCHSTIGIGDAENDLALLDACEIGVAVGHAVSSLKDRADLVLAQHGTEPVADFLATEVTRGVPAVQPRRRRVQLGIADNGAEVSIPASRVQVFVDGASGSGKSYLAGLIVENLITDGYSVCVLDMEGDHVNLGNMSGVLALGGREPLPPPEQVVRLIRHRFSSVVIDMSLREPALKYAYARDLLDRLTRLRRNCGLPHWICIEEAHMVPVYSILEAQASGSLCLVTYRPEWLSQTVVSSPDICITALGDGMALLRPGADATEAQRFRAGSRALSHIRHHRKYADICVPYEKGFTFRDRAGVVGRHVLSLAEFQREIQRVPPGMLEMHAEHRDFSRWVCDVFQDRELARLIRRVEETAGTDGLESLRTSINELLALRYDISAASLAGNPDE